MAINDYGGFAVAGQTQNANTAIVAGVPPATIRMSPPLVYNFFANRPNWYRLPRTRLTSLVYTTGTTAHTPVVMRPLNWAKITPAVAKNTTTFALADDPGVFSANYKYPLPGGATVEANVADNPIAAGDFVAYQLIDGTWVFDTVASGTFAALVLSTTIPNVTGGGVADGTPLFHFGLSTDTDPGTGLPHPAFQTTASLNNVNLFGDVGSGVTTLHNGDPMIIYSGNATAAGKLVSASGYFTKS